MSAPREIYDVAIVGSGFAGLGMAIRLKQEGRRSFVVLERADDVGGTWRENHYPGCACDVPSHLYSFSFAPNPGWSRHFAPQREILEYLRGCADRYGVRPHIRFRTSVEGAELDEKEAVWRVRTSGGTIVARHLVLGIGGLSRPQVPKLRGLERFRGAAFHSAAWDHSVSLDGKRVAVVGTGASAIQIVPNIVGRVGKLHLFQRTAPWVLPHPDRAISALERRLFSRVPALQRLLRWAIYWQHESRAFGFTVEPRLMAIARRLGEWNIRRQIDDPALRERVTPKFVPGCKRLLMSNSYYRALAKPNAEVVTAPIREITGEAIVDEEGVARPVDAIVLATGFDVLGFASGMRVVGRGGRVLDDEWAREGVSAYRGTTVAGFPNLYLITGPNTGLAHNSMVFMIESQIGYILRCMRALDERGARALDVKPEAQAAFNATIAPRLARTVWASGCRSWYLDERGRNPILWPGFTVEFWLKSRRFRAGDHRFDPPSEET